MRPHKQLVTHQSILQVLQEFGCPFCRFLKEFQALRLQNHRQEEIRRLCNFHAWGLAAIQDAPAAAQVFLKMLEDTTPQASADSECDICKEICAEEDLRLHEFVSCLSMKVITQWFSAAPALCIPHGIKLRRQVPTIFTNQIDAIIESHRERLAQELMQLSKESELDRAGLGSLGRTAEFLVAQRGLQG
ncbi:MAG: hypothetical protein WBG35_15410 [Acidobacteriaceae bacterium]